MPALSAPSAMGSLGLLFLVLAVLSQPARAGPVWRVITVNNNLTCVFSSLGNCPPSSNRISAVVLTLCRVPRLAMASITNGVWSFFAGGWYSAGVRSECELIDLRNGFSSACTNALDVFDPLTSIMLSTALPALQKTAMMVVGLGSKIYMGGMHLRDVYPFGLRRLMTMDRRRVMQLSYR